MNDKHSPNPSELVEAFRGGSLAAMIFSNFGHVGAERLDELIRLCASLHNDNKIDLLSLACPEQLARIEPATFFAGQYFFCKAIPLLAGSVEDVMVAVTSLVDKGGQDLASDQPHAAFRAWCAVDAARSREIIEHATAGHALAKKLLTFALEAWNMVDDAMALLESPSGDIKLSAVTALGRMTLAANEDPLVVLQSLQRTLDTASDDLHVSNVLVAALSICSRSEDARRPTIEILRRAAARGNGTIRESCAYALRRHGRTLPQDVVELLLETLALADPSEEAILRELDGALRTLLDSAHRDRVIAFVGQLLAAAEGRLTGSHFEGFGGRLKQDQKQELWATLIAWLLSGEQVLCEWVSSLVNEELGDEPAELPKGALDLPGVHRIFLARKVIGYLFQKPVCCTSILVSVLEAADAEVADHIVALIFDPMLINYGGALREYLDAVPSTTPAYSHVQKAIRKADDFLAGLLPMGAIKELHPSEHQLQIAFQRTSDQMSAAMKQAQEGSVLLSLVSRSVALHGRRVLTYLSAPGYTRQPMEINLHPHSVSIEMPRLLALDPVGLDYLLRVFRAERMAS